ncbi:winged helix-turn-helix transcriptional regulator [Marimonas lutisalis]|uniref:winged helix-turn-helix transcriptional regulator n=1 Tax=Marimonas lutisalis TaxID=2545756 RepID=UPI0010F50C19|nr:helix-turn-helix domain-containing protein [Marimonas lutisalis]
MATEILGSRWTIILIRELCAGSTRFNDLRRGVPRMSSALLTKRLRELENHGIVERRATDNSAGQFEYHLTDAGKALTDIIVAIGIWGQKWINAELQLNNTDPSLLMWDMRRSIRRDLLPDRRVNVQFEFTDVTPREAQWWVVCDPDQGVDLCLNDPGFDVDLYVVTDIKTMTAIWMGLESVSKALEVDKLHLSGDTEVANAMSEWLGLSLFAPYPKEK